MGKDAGNGPAHSPLVHSTLPPPQVKKTKPWKEMAQRLQDGHGEGGISPVETTAADT